MSFHVFFAFSSGLSETLKVPKGTLKSIINHIQHIEMVLGFKKEKYKNNPIHWVSTEPTIDISDEIYCSEIEKHNLWVRCLYEDFDKWFKFPVPDGELLSPEDAQKFWYALQVIDVPPHRWTADYYRKRMEILYEVMRGHESEGIIFDEKPLSPKQAGAVIHLFEQYLDPGDIRLSVPKGHDSLFSSDEYIWCDKCGAIAEDDVESEVRNCRKRGGCPLREQYGRED